MWAVAKRQNTQTRHYRQPFCVAVGDTFIEPTNASRRTARENHALLVGVFENFVYSVVLPQHEGVETMTAGDKHDIVRQNELANVFDAWIKEREVRRLARKLIVEFFEVLNEPGAVSAGGWKQKHFWIRLWRLSYDI